MAGVFCDFHRGQYHGKYDASGRMPVASPNNQDIFCCKWRSQTNCSGPVRVWLSSDEDAEYQKGERIFTVGYFICVKVQ